MRRRCEFFLKGVACRDVLQGGDGVLAPWSRGLRPLIERRLIRTALTRSRIAAPRSAVSTSTPSASSRGTLSSARVSRSRLAIASGAWTIIRTDALGRRGCCLAVIGSIGRVRRFCFRVVPTAPQPAPRRSVSAGRSSGPAPIDRIGRYLNREAQSRIGRPWGLLRKPRRA